MAKRKPPSPFLRFNSSPEVSRLAVMYYVKYPLSLRNAEDRYCQVNFLSAILGQIRGLSDREKSTESVRARSLAFACDTNNSPLTRIVALT
jgi:hypothetical protein